MDLIDIERSLITTFRKDIYRPFTKALDDYHLLEPNDRIAVCISGGKDSFTLAKLLQEVQKHGRIPFELEFIAMNPGFNEDNLHKMKENAELLGIPLEIYNSDIFDVTQTIAKEYPCYMCARMRRGFLYKIAQDKKCNKIALGHHFDDVIETIMLNILYGGSYKTMMPKLKSTNFEGIELIRPMTLVKEQAIKRYMKHINIQTMNCGCRVASGELPSKRKEIKDLIENLRKVYHNVDYSIYRSSQNVNLNCCLGWIDTSGEKKFFLDDYDERKNNDE